MLRIVDYIKEFGLDRTILDFNLICRVYDKKILLKYNQIESDLSKIEVQEARGLILEKNTWKIMCLAFKKFFNHGERNAHDIDWNSALVLEKLDGSLIQLYWDWNKEEWCVATSGMAEGEGDVNNKQGLSFSDLFLRVFKTYGINFNDLDTDMVYVFELTTPYNIVVKPHPVSSITLLTIRDRTNLKELDRSDLIRIANGLNIPYVKAISLNQSSVSEIINRFDDMPFTEEGYVVVDSNFNRIKIKNPKYVAVHHLKNRTAEHHIMTIIKENETEEYISTFPERKEEILSLVENYHKLRQTLHNIWDEIKSHIPQDKSGEERKRFALKVIEIGESNSLDDSLIGLFFGLYDGKIESIDVFLLGMDDKKLYKML